MALRVEITGRYFLGTDTVTGETVIEKMAAEIHAEDDANNNVYLFHKGNRVGRLVPYVESDFVNGADSDNPFSDHATLMTWFRENTGFNSPVGGSAGFYPLNIINEDPRTSDIPENTAGFFYNSGADAFGIFAHYDGAVYGNYLDNL